MRWDLGRQDSADRFILKGTGKGVNQGMDSLTFHGDWKGRLPVAEAVRLRRKTDVFLHELRVRESGRGSRETFEGRARPGEKLTFSSTNSAFVNPVEEVARLSKGAFVPEKN